MWKEKIKGILDKLDDGIVDIGIGDSTEIIIGGQAKEDCAEEIASISYPKEFVIWFQNAELEADGKYWIGGNETYTLDELFNYWETNIKDKRYE